MGVNWRDKAKAGAGDSGEVRRKMRWLGEVKGLKGLRRGVEEVKGARGVGRRTFDKFQ